jgi:hypothetical protein
LMMRTGELPSSACRENLWIPAFARMTAEGFGR